VTLLELMRRFRQYTNLSCFNHLCRVVNRALAIGKLYLYLAKPSGLFVIATLKNVGYHRRVVVIAKLPQESSIPDESTTQMREMLAIIREKNQLLQHIPKIAFSISLCAILIHIYRDSYPMLLITLCLLFTCF